MKPNIGRTDRIIRIILAILIAAAGIYFKSWWGLLAVIPLFTALFSFCLLYKIIGINTSSHKPVQ
jgi:hypothetical protein